MAPGPSGSKKVTRLRPKVACPVCGNVSEQANFPFCSTRCRSADLDNWLSDVYSIEAVDEPETVEPKDED